MIRSDEPMMTYRGRAAVGAAVVMIGVVVAVAVTWRSPGAADPESIDVSDVTTVERMPRSILAAGGESFSQEEERRLEAWVDLIAADSLSTAEVASTMDLLTGALMARPNTDDSWMVARELMFRRDHLCHLLPEGHRYRGGEYCD